MNQVTPIAPPKNRVRIYIERFIFLLRNFLAGLRTRRVPVMLQMSNVECGAAALAMILNYHGYKVSVSDCMRQTSIGRDGLSASSIAKAGRQYGLAVKAFAIENIKDFQYVALPAIVHWEFDHFVIVEKWQFNKITLIDPAIGRVEIDHATFGKKFTGIVLTLQPGAAFHARQQQEPSMFRKYVSAMLKMPGVTTAISQVLLASICVQLVGITFPFITQIVVDRVLPYRLSNTFTILGIGLIFLIITFTVISYLRSTLLIYLRGKLDMHLMMSFLGHMLRLPASFFEQRSTGDLVMRLGSNAHIRNALSEQAVSAIFDGSLTIGYLTFITWRDPFLGMTSAVLGALHVLVVWSNTKRLEKMARQNLQTNAEEQGYLVEILSGVKTVKAIGAEQAVFEHWTNLFNKYLNVTLNMMQLSARLNTVVTTLNITAPLLLLWIGAQRVLSGNLSLGEMLALNAIALAFLRPLTALVRNAQELKIAGTHLERIRDVLDTELEQHGAAHKELPKLNGHIQFDAVSFRYSDDSPLVLQDISFEIRPKQKIAIVGHTGSGKTTLAMLMLGLYEPASGTILYDGQSAQQFDYSQLREQFGVVLQDSFLFDMSIRQNVALGNPDMPLEQVIHACKLAVIHDDIMRMPLGYETRVGENGESVSGGQKQRISLARALVHNPKLLLLDEATSHLDQATERVIDDNLNQLSSTRIVIAHRLSTVINADHILVMHQGKLVEQGTHQTLLEKNQYYAALIRYEKKHDLTKNRLEAVSNTA
ncbi:MAG TPA: peptidase domain-containing ABC transporter [Anaerolineae bacterium]|nr:peptidase domain-containing ABC transporter [Anaerolineae bacterium]